jgi:hypothetical protein
MIAENEKIYLTKQGFGGLLAADLRCTIDEECTSIEDKDSGKVTIRLLDVKGGNNFLYHGKLSELIESPENNLKTSYTLEEIGRLRDIYLMKLDDTKRDEDYVTDRQRASAELANFLNWLVTEDRRDLLNNADVKINI